MIRGWHTEVNVMCLVEQAEHKKTFYFLEQMVMKHRSHNNVSSVKSQAGTVWLGGYWS